MDDLKPPRLADDERQTVMALLQYQRSSFVKKVSGVSEESARQLFAPSGANLLWLTKHMSRAEALWLLYRFAGQDGAIDSDAVTPNDSLQSAIDAYQEIWAQTDAVVAAAPNLDVLCQNVGDESPVNLRWVLMHLLEETARHAGHVDILRELVDGQTGR